MIELGKQLPLIENEKEFADLKVMIKKKIGFNCDQYKPSHLKRRLAVRMRATNVRSFKEYMLIFIKNESESKKLKETLTVNVTELFRNPETYEVFRKIVLPRLIKAKEREHKIKVWSAGCSDGEEPYSIAILFYEMLRFSSKKFHISIIGTDIDEESLRKAENGIYQTKHLEKISSERLKNFFTREDKVNYRVKDEIRNMVEFRQHDMISGPRIYGYDIIFCRNVTIYFEQKLQEKLYMKFYDALNEGGYFIMGKTETLVGPAANKFKPVEPKERIYQKNEVIR